MAAVACAGGKRRAVVTVINISRDTVHLITRVAVVAVHPAGVVVDVGRVTVLFLVRVLALVLVLDAAAVASSAGRVGWGSSFKDVSIE
jgi:hypothetical protein